MLDRETKMKNTIRCNASDDTSYTSRYVESFVTQKTSVVNELTENKENNRVEI